MDVAAVAESDELISIGRYRRLPPDRRPTRLRCAGRLSDGSRCSGEVFPRALDSSVVAAHFFSRNHGQGCDEATSSETIGDPHDEDDTARVPEAAAPTHLIILTPTHSPSREQPDPAAGPDVQQQPPPAPPRRLIAGPPEAGGQREVGLRSALRTLAAGGFPDEAKIRWAGATLAAARFFVHLDSVDPQQRSSRGYWGIVDSTLRYRRTGAVHLHPRRGVMLVLEDAVAAQLGLEGAADQLQGRYVLAVATVRTSQAGRPYILVTDAGAFASWTRPR